MRIADRIQLRRRKAQDWLEENPILFRGEPGFEIDTGRLKIGNGTSTWQELNYVDGPTPGFVLGETSVLAKEYGDLDLLYYTEAKESTRAAMVNLSVNLNMVGSDARDYLNLVDGDKYSLQADATVVVETHRRVYDNPNPETGTHTFYLNPVIVHDPDGKKYTFLEFDAPPSSLFTVEKAAVLDSLGGYTVESGDESKTSLRLVPDQMALPVEETGHAVYFDFANDSGEDVIVYVPGTEYTLSAGQRLRRTFEFNTNVALEGEFFLYVASTSSPTSTINLYDVIGSETGFDPRRPILSNSKPMIKVQTYRGPYEVSDSVEAQFESQLFSGSFILKSGARYALITEGIVSNWNTSESRINSVDRINTGADLITLIETPIG